MAAKYFMLKMLKNKQTTNNTARSKIVQKRLLKPNVHSSLSQDISKQCRICLKHGSIPIYGAEGTIDLSNYICTIGGINVSVNDEYPKYLCEECHSLLKGAVIFRESAKQSDEVLRRTNKQEEAEETFNRKPDTPIISEDDMIDHSGIEITEISKKYITCKICKLKFNTLQAFIIHSKSKKHKNVFIQCKVCQKLFAPHLYCRHLHTHELATHLVCEVCGKLCRKDNLLRHLQLHSNDLPFQCQVCPYRGRFIESLRLHMRTHSGEKPHACYKCECRFITKSNLNRHLLTHGKEKPFKCVECDRGFYSQPVLDTHVRSDHAGIKDFGCGVCGNRYSTKKALHRHEIRVHKRDKLPTGRTPLYLQVEYQKYQKIID